MEVIAGWQEGERPWTENKISEGEQETVCG